MTSHDSPKPSSSTRVDYGSDGAAATLHWSHPTDAQFQRDVLDGLSRSKKALPCKYLYDPAGSALFDQICELPEYYLTRTESQIMEQSAAEIAGALGPRPVVVELGSGSSTKTRILLDNIHDAAYVPVDISREHLLSTADTLREDYPEHAIAPVVADFMSPFHLSDQLSHSDLASYGSVTVYFPGSTIGNLTQAEARTLLKNIAGLSDCDGEECHPGLLIGIDLVKDTSVLEAAYNDAQGVSSAFSLNLLKRINRELEADFQVSQFAHTAFFNEQHARIEIYLESKVDQTVTVAGEEFEFGKGERIHTEFSHKYTIDSFVEIAAQAGFELKDHWTDAKKYFAILLLTPKAQ